MGVINKYNGKTAENASKKREPSLSKKYFDHLFVFDHTGIDKNGRDKHGSYYSNFEYVGQHRHKFNHKGYAQDGSNCND